MTSVPDSRQRQRRGSAAVEVRCALCGRLGRKREMVNSRHTGNSYCRGVDDCRERAGRAGGAAASGPQLADSQDLASPEE